MQRLTTNNQITPAMRASQPWRAVGAETDGADTPTRRLATDVVLLGLGMALAALTLAVARALGLLAG
jgi:hypothetical protein